MKHLTKVLLTIVAALVVVLTSTYHVEAAADTIQLGPATQAGKYIAGVTFSYKTTTDGKYLYCINMHKNTAQNVTADLVRNSSAINGGVVYILKNGYPNKSITGNKDKDYYITQTALWWYLDETTGSQNLGDYFKVSGSDAYNLRHYVKSLMQAGVQHKNDSTSLVQPTLKLSTSSTQMKLVGDYYVSEYIVASQHNDIKNYKVTLEGAPSGTFIEVGEPVSNSGSSATISASGKFAVRIPKASVTKDLSFKVVATGTGSTQYMAYEYRPRKDNMQNVALLEPTTLTARDTLTLTVKKPTIVDSKVSVIKIDSKTQKPLAGAVLALLDKNGKELTRWTSNENAHVFNKLANGTYTIKEISAPTGYKLNNNPISFTITDTNRNIKIKFENTPKELIVNPRVSITKIDSDTQRPLAGAVLALSDANGREIERWTTTELEKVFTKLANGTYSVKEISAPSGYKLNNKPVTFTITDTNRHITINFENEPEQVVETSKVTIVKIDSTTQQPLAGAVLALSDSTGKELTRWTTTTNAHVIKNLANGTYTVSEISAPSGYKLNTNKSTFTITDTNKNIKINFENAPNKAVVNITKVDSETQQPLAGALLVIKDSNGGIIYKFTSTTSPEVITDIEYGTYTVEEISAPDGYVKSDKIVTFTIDENHLSYQITFENAKAVWVPDTASVSPLIMMILGIAITGYGIEYVYKHGQKA